jgi:hypothetical protein
MQTHVRDNDCSGFVGIELTAFQFILCLVSMDMYALQQQITSPPVAVIQTNLRTALFLLPAFRMEITATNPAKPST